MKFSITFLILAFFLTCNQATEKKTKNLSKDNQDDTVVSTDENEEFETLEIADFNDFLMKEERAYSSFEVLQLFYPGQLEGYEDREGREKVDVQEETLDNGNLLITLIHDNLMDDSVKGEKYVMELKNTNDTWTVVAAKRNWKCREGRGHTDWGTELCL